MLKHFRERFADLFQRNPEAPPPLNEDSSLHELAAQYARLYDFIERKYGVKVESEDRTLSLRHFVEKYGLPPAQILFMEAQMSSRIQAVRPLLAREAFELIRDPEVRVLDVREDWETEYGRLPGARSLKPELLDEILRDWAKGTKCLLYCHYGIRSLDAATFLADRGFTEVYTLQGGIEAWSRDVDPSVPLYDSAYC